MTDGTIIHENISAHLVVQIMEHKLPFLFSKKTAQSMTLDN